MSQENQNNASKTEQNRGKFKKGKSKTGGRAPGTQNKFTMSAKEAFQKAFNEIGGAKALAEWAKSNPTEFYKIYSKLIPVDLTSGEKPIVNYIATINERGQIDIAESV